MDSRGSGIHSGLGGDGPVVTSVLTTVETGVDGLVLALAVLLLLIVVPLFFVAYGVYAFFRARELIVRLGGPTSASAVVLIRIIACLGFLAGSSFLVMLIVNVVNWRS
jgi:hypothetical protein